MTEQKKVTTQETLISKIKNIRGMMWSHLGNPSLRKIKGTKIVKIAPCEGGGQALSGVFFDEIDTLLDEAEEYLESKNVQN